MDWRFDNERPIYVQLVEQIERAIISGTFTLGEKLPSVRDLAMQAGVNPNTMQRAMAQLEESGLVYSQRTSGRFVTDDEKRTEKMREEMAKEITKEYLQKMIALGCTPQDVVAFVQEIKEEL